MNEHDSNIIPFPNSEERNRRAAELKGLEGLAEEAFTVTPERLSQIQSVIERALAENPQVAEVNIQANERRLEQGNSDDDVLDLLLSSMPEEWELYPSVYAAAINVARARGLIKETD